MKRAVYEGSEALAIMRTESHDAVIIDVGMPGMTGYQLAQCIREDPAIATPRLIAMTGYGSEQDRGLAMQSGFDVHLTKPVSLAKLVSALTPSDSATSPGDSAKRG
jgi:CheY-like chemotaxis protein